MTCHYPDLGSVSNWPEQISLAIRQIGSNSQLWVVTRYQYGISAALVPQTRHFVGKPVVALWNVSFFLRLTAFRWRDCTVIKLQFTGKSMSKEIKAHSPLVHRTTQRLRMDYDTIRFLTGNWRETACSYDCKRQWNLLQNCKCYIKLDSVISRKERTRLGILA